MIREGVRAHDEAVGHALPGAQTIARALAERAREHVPNVGRAWFEARLTSDGELVGLHLLSYDRRDGPIHGWLKTAVFARRDLAGFPFRVPSSFAGGAVVRVRVDSNLELPSGSGRTYHPGPAAREPMRAPSWPFLPSAMPSEQLAPALRPEPIETGGFMGTVHIDFPTCITTRTRVCPGGHFDLADIGAHPQRVVRTHVEAKPVPTRPAGTLAFRPQKPVRTRVSTKGRRTSTRRR